MTITVSTINIRYEQDVVFCRQRARQIARLLGFDNQDQTRIATAVSEIARNAYKYARDGKVEFLLEDDAPARFHVRISDKGPGIAELSSILEGTYRSETGMGLGIIGAKRLMDRFEIQSGPREGTTISLVKTLPTPLVPRTGKLAQTITEALAREPPRSPLEEIRLQNQELLEALAQLQKQRQDLEDQRRELRELNRELEETNRGVVALYAELDEKATSLQRANDLKTRFLSNMSHEVRTPLNSILSLSQMLLERMDGELNEEQERQVGYIRKSTEELYDLVNDLLDIAKIDAGKTMVRVEEFEVREIFAALRGMFRPFTTRRVSLVTETPVDLPPLHSDRGKIAQILRNLVSNALKFTPEGEVRVGAERGSSGTVVFSVRDTGIGIAPEDHQRIFEEFNQIESPLQRHVKGTGLGLPLSRKLARLLGGELTLKSRPGEGSVFSVALPVRYAKPERTIEDVVEKQRLGFTPMQSVTGALRELSQGAEGSSLGRKIDELQKVTNAEKILIIDDNEIARYILNDILMDEGYTTIEADRGEEGIRLARELHPRAIFLDLVMPGMNGYEVLEALQAAPETRDVPVIINTSELLGEQELKRLTTAAAAIVLKDVSIRKSTSERIREALERAGLRAPNREAI